jgi:TFIIF-interacting CTD phosphatase-like protein
VKKKEKKRKEKKRKEKKRKEKMRSSSLNVDSSILHVRTLEQIKEKSQSENKHSSNFDLLSQVSSCHHVFTTMTDPIPWNCR